MPISKKAIEAFLTKPLPHLPKFKGADEAALMRLIYDSTGQPYAPITTPRKHQLDGVAFALYQRRAVLQYDPRLGKTKMALDWAMHLRKANLWRAGKKGLVIAHSPVGLSVWKHEIAKHSNLSACYVQNDVQEFIDALATDVDLIVLPWSGLQAIFSEKRLAQRGRRAGKPKLYPFYAALHIAAEEFGLVIADEIHMCNNHMSLRFKIAAKIIEGCRFRLGLTGTPIGRNKLAIWPSSYLLDEGAALSASYPFFEAAFSARKKNWFGRHKGLFKNEKTGVETWANYDYVFDNDKLPLLQAKLATLAISYKLKEVRAVDVRPDVIELTMSLEQAEAYNEVVQRARMIHSGDVHEIQNSFVRLRQISSGFIPFTDSDGKQHMRQFTHPSKVEWLSDLLEKIDPDLALIIFHEFTESGDRICGLLEAAKIKHAWFYGGTKDKDAIGKFQRGDINVLVANTAKGGMSIDLHRADYMLFYESPVSPITRTQAEARPLAEQRGKRPLIIDDLVCSPIERRVRELVREGKNALKALTSAPRSWEMLDLHALGKKKPPGRKAQGRLPL
jgi:hypothetical protein